MNTKKFQELILNNETNLVQKVLQYAKERNYVKYTSTLLEAWRMSISGLSKSILTFIQKNNFIPEMDPDEDYSKNEAAEFGIIEARKHRSRGITLVMFLGLMKYYNQAYTDLIFESNFSPQEKEYFAQFIRRYFDQIELGFIAEWDGLTKNQELEELQNENRKITNEKNKYLTVFESIYDPIILVDKDNNIENLNFKATEAFLNQPVSGMKYYSNTYVEQELKWLTQELNFFIGQKNNEILKEKTVETKAGKKTFLIKFKRMLDVSEKYSGTVIIFYDITERKIIEEKLKLQHDKLEFYAYTDPMTNVSNRRTGLLQLEKEIALVKERDMPSSICYIDVDGLKAVNDSYGHSEGDRLIKIIASCVKSSLREKDTVSRIGGDEFLIIFPEYGECEAAKTIDIINYKLQDYNKEPVTFQYSFSYGIVELSKKRYLSANDVIKAADQKMYQNKVSKRSQNL